MESLIFTCMTTEAQEKGSWFYIRTKRFLKFLSSYAYPLTSNQIRVSSDMDNLKFTPFASKILPYESEKIRYVELWFRNKLYPSILIAFS